MKANELMIGDWVNIKEYPMKFEPKKFTEHHWVRSLCEFEPIQLTDDILKANGFVRRVHLIYQVPNYGRPKSYLFVHPYSGETNGRLTFVPNNEGVTLYCNYVHELQHALRLCGLNDLADNLKLN